MKNFKKIASGIAATMMAVSMAAPGFAANGRLTSQQANEIALQQTGGGQVTKSKLDRDNGMYIYEIDVRNGSYKYELDVDATDGEVLKYDKEIPVRERSRVNNMSTAEAASIAQAKVGASATIYKNVFTRNGGQAHYSVKLRGNGFEYEVKINATTKEVYEYEKDGVKVYNTNNTGNTNNSNTANTMITAAKAQEVAFAKVGGGTLKKCKLDRENGKYVYEVEIKNGRYDHEFDIDAYTGTILKYEIDD